MSNAAVLGAEQGKNKVSVTTSCNSERLSTNPEHQHCWCQGGSALIIHFACHQAPAILIETPATNQSFTPIPNHPINPMIDLHLGMLINRSQASGVRAPRDKYHEEDLTSFVGLAI